MNPHPWSAVFPLQLDNHSARQSRLRLCSESEAGRETLQAFIHACFKLRHEADLVHYLPELIGLQDSQGQLRAAAGLHVAGQQKLFLEHYLDSPLESVVARFSAVPVAREHLVEVGNLASLCAGSARLIIIAVTWLLAMRGLQWVAFTGGPGLLNSFHRLGLQPQVIAVADPARLGAEQARWGRYYQQHPQVYLGNIVQGHGLLQRSGLYSRLGVVPQVREAGHAA
jgi:hypothetical protein